MASNLQETKDRMWSDAIKTQGNVDSTIRSSAIKMIIESLAAPITERYSEYQLLRQALLLSDSSGTFLNEYGRIYRVTRNIATEAKGTVVAPGVNGAEIPESTSLTSPSGQIYTTDSTQNVSQISFLANVSLSGLIATFEYANHGLATGLTITVSGAINPVINGNYQITVTNANEFEVTISQFIGNGSFGTANVNTFAAIIPVTSVSAASAANQPNGSSFTYSDGTPTGMDSNVYVDFNGITGGSDEEDDDSYKSRIFYRIQNPIADSSSSAYVNKLLSIAGITRAWCRRAYPAVNNAKIYYVRDNESPIFPSPADLANVKLQLIIPTGLPEANLVLQAPTDLPITFDFSSITPDSQEMRETLEANLRQFFRNSVTMGFEASTIFEIEYKRVIENTINPDTGEIIEAYALNTPLGDIAVADEELPTFAGLTVTP